MLQLIIGILLGVILLFVIVLLITEMASTYPVLKSLDTHNGSSFEQPVHHKKERTTNGMRITLVVFLCILGFGVAAFLISNSLMTKDTAPAESLPVGNASLASPAVERRLTDVSEEYGLLFTLQTKWEDGKIYGNNRIAFQRIPTANFSEWLYSLLDKDGFLIREFHFSTTDFVAETDTSGRTSAFLNRFNAEMSLKEYQRIDRLQVVVDKRIPLPR